MDPVILLLLGSITIDWAWFLIFTRFLDHTQRRNTVGRTPLNEWSVRRRDLYLTTHNNHNRHPCPPTSWGFLLCRPNWKVVLYGMQFYLASFHVSSELLLLTTGRWHFQSRVRKQRNVRSLRTRSEIDAQLKSYLLFICGFGDRILQGRHIVPACSGIVVNRNWRFSLCYC